MEQQVVSPEFSTTRSIRIPQVKRGDGNLDIPIHIVLYDGKGSRAKEIQHVSYVSRLEAFEVPNIVTRDSEASRNWDVLIPPVVSTSL
jgi:hypothetical protein